MSIPAPSCPCINTTLDGINGLLDVSSSGGNECENISFTKAPFSSSSENISACVGPDFGTTCGSWWSRVFSNCTEDWCDQKWCFADPNTCQYKNYPANLLGTEDVVVSYGTCGNLGTYSEANLFNDMQGENIRLSFPDSGNAYQFIDENNNYDGSTVQLVKQILIEPFNMKVTITNISQFSLDRYASTYTACVHDVSLGLTDLCLAGFYRTADRVLLAPFTTVFEKAGVYLIVNTGFENTKTSFWEYLTTPLHPVSWGAWLAVSFVSIYMEWALRIVHRKMENKRAQNPIKEFGTASFNAILSITSGSVANVPERTSAGEKFVIGGYAIFAFIFMSAYTASFTLKLIQSTNSDTESSLRSIVQGGGKICVLESLQETLLRKYEFITTDKIISVEDHYVIVNEMDNGNCIGGVFSPYYYNYFRGTDENFCRTKTIMGSELFSRDLALPVSPKFSQVLSYTMRDAINRGIFEDLKTSYEELFLHTAICTDDDSSRRRLKTSGGSSGSASVSATSVAIDEDANSSTDSTGSTMGLLQMILPILISFIGTTVGLALFLLKKYRDKVQLGKKKLANMWDDQHLHWAAQGLPTETLIDFLEQYDDGKVQAALRKAIDELPDRLELERLLYRQVWDDVSFVEYVHGLHPQPSSSIFKSLCNWGPEVKEEATECLKSDNPRDGLITLAIRYRICPPEKDDGGGIVLSESSAQTEVEEM